MKRSVLAASVTMLATGAACAQSSVTLYGRIDNGIVYRTGMPGGSMFGAQSGGWGESWWGLTGTEDLGGGSAAIFKLESGISTMNGAYQNGGLFGRHAYVGLQNNSYGTLKLGNLGAGEMSQDSWDLDPQVLQQYSNPTLVRGRNWAQAGSGIEYTSPSLYGLTIKGQYDLANSPNWNGNGGTGSGPGQLGGSQGRSDALKLQYNATNFELQAIYDEIRDPNGQFSNVYVASRSLIAGGTYTAGPVKLFLAYQHLSAPEASLAGYGLASTAGLPSGTSLPTAVNHEWLGATWTINYAFAVTGAVYHANANNGNGNATMYTLNGTYNLSKRTFLYTELAYVHNSQTSNVGLGDGYSDGYGPQGTATGVFNNSQTPQYGHGEFGAIAGIMTMF